VTAATRFLAESPSIDLLKGLEPRLAQMDRRELAEGLSPVLARLQERLPDAERAKVAESVFAFCRRLYSNARSGDGLALARGLLAQAILADDAALERRASSVCGVLAADTADVVGAIDYQARALALADSARDPAARATAWNNIGLAFGVAGNYALSVQCGRRALAAVEQVPGPVHGRYTACNNLSIGLYQTGDFAAALRFGELALQSADPSFIAQNPHSAILLRRNLARLYVSAGRMAEAAEQVAQVAVLTAQSSSPR